MFVNYFLGKFYYQNNSVVLGNNVNNKFSNGNFMNTYFNFNANI